MKTTMKFIASALSLLASLSLSSCNAETPLLRAAISAEDSQKKKTRTHTIIDLSQDIPRDEAAISSSPGAKAVQEAASQLPELLNFMVVENGSIVSSYTRDDVDPNETHVVHSVTKSWMSLLLGIMVEDGLLSLDTTLGEIFTSDDAWADVTDGSIDFRKGATIEELLTMTSGLLENHVMHAVFWGGESLQGSLSYPNIGVKGEWSYLTMTQIPSYIIVELTGMTPRQYVAKHVMEKLGVGEDEYGWTQNEEEVEWGFAGMYLTPMQMAKFGQLYLQGGRTSPSNDERVISQEWIDASFAHHSTTDFSDNPYLNDHPDYLRKTSGWSYGYLFYEMYETPSGSTVWCAFGNHGQFICVDRDLGRVVIQQRKANDPTSVSMDMFKALDFVFENTLSFRAPGFSGISSTVM